ncbi:sulfatase family protein [Flammeovirga kamogawensis]|nr:sulfatase-like hydrolase/transferase [Flammeovirga kamogawensis]
MKSRFKKIINCLVLLLCLITKVSAQEQPNIIFILADDMGYGDMEVYGHPYTKTPHLDKLANSGKVFTQGYMSAAWCSPSRAALMTGIYPAREFLSTFCIDVEKPSITKILHNGGYKTAHFGKWHIGGGKRSPNAPPPSAYGIDESFTTQSTGDGFTREDKKLPHYREHTTTKYIDLAIDFAKRNKKEPFFINLWLYPTHSYINPLPQYLERFKDLKVNIDDFEGEAQRDFLTYMSKHTDINKSMQAYCADVANLDDEIGRLLTALKKMKLDKNTIIIFSSDNGPGPILNNIEKLQKRFITKPLLVNSVGSVGEFQGRKGSMYEGGIRAPWIISWPKYIKKGITDTETILTGVDFLPTLSAMVGAETPKDLVIDGEDMSKAVLGNTHPRTKMAFFSDKPNWYTVRDGKWKAHLHLNKIKLYDIESDKGEKVDLTAQEPEIARKYEKILRQMKKEFHQKEAAIH